MIIILYSLWQAMAGVNGSTRALNGISSNVPVKSMIANHASASASTSIGLIYTFFELMLYLRYNLLLYFDFEIAGF